MVQHFRRQTFMHDTPESLMLVLAKGAGGSRVTVDLETFLQFNAEIDCDLETLVDRWSDFATPSSMSADVAESRDF